MFTLSRPPLLIWSCPYHDVPYREFAYNDETRTSDWFPWRSREQLLISAWQEVHDISIKCLDDLLHLLHEPGFDIQKLPTSAYLIRKHVRDSLPIIIPGDS